MAARAFLLAAGLGTRLRPLTLHRPKPLLPVCGVPVLDQALALCLHYGLDEVVVNAHHLHAQVETWARRVVGARVTVQVELPQILGTGGGLRQALDLLDSPFVVVNGDILCDADLGALRDACRDHDAALLLREHPDAARFGVVAADPQGVVVRLAGVASDPDAVPVSSSTHFTGIHAMTRGALGRVPSPGFACVIRTAYRELVPARRVAAVVHAGSWVDVGDPRSYLDANWDALEGRLSLPLDPQTRQAGPGECVVAHGAVLRPPVWIGRGVLVEAGAQVGPRVILGDGARVGARAALREVVVWDGCRVEPGTPLAGAVVHDGGILSVGT